MALEIKKLRFLQKKEWFLCNGFFLVIEFSAFSFRIHYFS
jgi:hypothetical protein